MIKSGVTCPLVPLPGPTDVPALKGWSEIVNRRRTDNTKNKTNKQTMVSKTLKLNQILTTRIPLKTALKPQVLEERIAPPPFIKNYEQIVPYPSTFNNTLI